MKCPNCARWEAAESDLYCAWCGTKLVDFEIECRPSRAYALQVVPPVELRIKNTGHFGAIIVRNVVCTQPWIRIDGSIPAAPILSDHSSRVTLEVDSWDLQDDYHDALVKVDTNAGTKQVEFSVVPEPQDLSLETGEFEIFLDGIASEQNVCRLSLTRGAVTLVRLETDVDWAKLRLPQQLPILLDARHRPKIEFNVEVLESVLQSRVRNLPERFQGNIVVEYQEIGREARVPFSAVCFKPPMLLVSEEESRPVEALVGQPNVLTVNLWNGDQIGAARVEGRAVLKIFSISTEQSGRPCLWLQVPADLKFPLKIEGSKFLQLSLGISTASVTTPDAVGPGVHLVDLVFESNEVRGTRKRVTFQVNVKLMPDFAGLLAVDFGTTNTCVAAVLPSGEERLLSLDDSVEDPPTTVPSVVQYLNKTESDREYEVGFRPAAQMHVREAAESIVTSAKRYLGSTHVFSVSCRDHRDVRLELRSGDVVFDYLRKVRQHAERVLRARPRRVIITHPSRFALCQIKELHESARLCFGDDCQIGHLHEPVAAALSEIVSEKLASLPQYNLMVYDFGGGTTDITLIAVENCTDKGVVVTSPRVLGADGHNRAGGDDVTDLLIEMALKRCHEVFGSKQPERSNSIPVDTSVFTQPWRKRKAEENRFALRSWAEMTKVLLSKYGNSYKLPPERQNLLLHVFQPDSEQDFAFPHHEIAPKAEEFEARVETWIRHQQTVTKMRKLAEVNGVNVDYILLAGKSSNLHPVGALIKQEFPAAEILKPEDLKQCVVRGVCVLDRYREAGLLHELRIGGESAIAATTSRIGLKVAKYGESVFAEIVSAGVPIPEVGLVRAVPLPSGLTRRSRLTLLENTGLDDHLIIAGKQNPDVVLHGVSELSNVPESVTDLQLQRAVVELLVTRDLDLSLRARLPDSGTRASEPEGGPPHPPAEPQYVNFIHVRAEDRIAQA